MKISKKIKVMDPKGLHLRVAAQLVLLVRKYKSNVFIQKGLGLVNARSVLCLLQLAVVFGAELTFIFDGDDALQALEAIQKFLGNKGA